MKKIVLVLIIATVLIFTACTALDSVFSPDTEDVTGDQEKDSESNNEEQEKEEPPKEEEEEEEEDPRPEFTYPDAVRGIYVTGNTAGTNRFHELIDLVNETDLNSMVIDIKNDDGYITFKLEGTEYDEFSRNFIKDPEEMMEILSENEIYPIARIVVFKDTVLADKHPEYSFRNENGTVWKNNRNEAFVNPFMKEVWEYNLEIAEMAVELGFQEIQFDYVRFPEGFQNRDRRLQYDFEDYSEEKLTPRIIEEWEALLAEQEEEEELDFTESVIDPEDVVVEEDGEAVDQRDMDDDREVEQEEEELEPPTYNYGLARVMAVTDFVAYAYERLEPYDVDVSVDIFGYTATVPESRGIGQNFFKISQHVDIICSMIYPSHWGPGNLGVAKPDTQPYELVSAYAKKENELLDKMDNPPRSRPWIQDFTASWLGSGNFIRYGVDEVEGQIRALNENGIDEFLLWNASNRYTKGVNYRPLED